jgi:uncharacterized protein
MNANIQPNDWFTEVTKPKFSYWGQLGILIGLIGVGMIVATLIQLGFALAMVDGKSFFSLDENKLIEIMAKPQNFNKVVWMQVLGTLTIMALPAYVFAKIVSKQPLQYVGFSKKINYNILGLVIIIAIVGLALSASLGEVSKHIPLSNYWKLKADKWEGNYEKEIMIFANMKTWFDYFYSLILIAILPAIFEELLFRGALQNLLTKWTTKPHIAIAITAFLFSIMHISFYGFLSRMMLGMVLGYVYYYGKNIWLNILMHFINNGVAITAMFWALQSGHSATETMNDTLPMWIAPVSLIAMIGLLVGYKKICEKVM